MSRFKFQKYLLMIWFAGLTLLVGWGSSAQTNYVFNHICQGVCDLAWSPDGRVLAAVNRFGLWLYDVDEDDAPRLYPYENVTSVDFNSAGEQIALTSCSPATSSNRTCRGAISIFDLNTETFEEIYDFEFEVNNVQFSPDDQSIAVYQAKPGGRWGMRLIDLTSGRMVSVVSRGITNIISGYDFSEDGRYIALATFDRYHEIGQFSGITIWDTLTGHRVAIKPIQGFVSDVNFSSDNEVTLVRHYYDADATVFVWNFEGNTSFRRRFSTHSRPDDLSRYTLDEGVNYIFGDVVNDTFGHRSLHIWNLTTGEEVANVDVPDSYANVFTVNASVTRIANASSAELERRLDIWDVEQGRRVSFFLND